MPKKILAISLIFILFFAGFIFAGDIRFGSENEPPAPRLRYPIYDTVILTVNTPLEFRWFNDYVWTDHFILKLYKGYNMYESSLIYKQNISSGESAIKIESGLFKDGQVYTWSLVRVGFDGEKSDKSFNSFKVLRK